MLLQKLIPDPEERLRTVIRRHIAVVLSERDREITVMLHENHPLSPALRKRINARKKDYVHFLENLIGEVQRSRDIQGDSDAARGSVRSVGND